MIDEATLRASVPFVAALIRGENIPTDLSNQDIKPFALWQHGNVRYYNYNDAPPGSVAVHTVIGTVLKYGGYCGGGTESLMRQMQEADDHLNIGAHLIEMDSGGGEATNIETVARFIKNNLKKPVITWFNGTCASAAYYIAAASAEIYASEETDMVGSIGTLISFADFSEYYEKAGIKIHEIYADQSALKNEDFKQALEGNYKLLKENLLNPYAKRFIDTVKEFRPNMTDEDAYKGQIYMTEAATAIGMIDGQKTFEEAIERAIELSQKSNTNNMSFPRLEAILGYDIEVHNGGAFLRTDAIQLIERNIVAEGFEAVDTSQLESLTAAVTGLSDKIGTIQGDISGIRADITANSEAIVQANEEIKALGDQPGAKPTSVATDKDPSEGLVVDHIAAMAAEAKSNGRVETV